MDPESCMIVAEVRSDGQEKLDAQRWLIELYIRTDGRDGLHPRQYGYTMENWQEKTSPAQDLCLQAA